MKFNHYPSLFLVADDEEAKWFKVEKDSLKLIDSIVDRHNVYSDREAEFKTRASGKTIRSGAPEFENRREREHIHRHAKRIEEKTLEMIRDNKDAYMHVVLVEPERYLSHMQSMLVHKLGARDIRAVAGEFIHSSTQELRHVFEEVLKRPQFAA